ncbi:hypothetical protein HDU67_008569 [Dinochytrium kinnereticum]|nr:hypothetical protein HDU67_008569 [Dinochytrium kinnereticum]
MDMTDHDNQSVWILDSGASDIFVRSKEHFIDFSESTSRGIALVGDNDHVKIKGRGTICLLANGDPTKRVVLEGCLYTPELAANLVSVSKLTAQVLIHNCLPWSLKASRREKLYRLNSTPLERDDPLPKALRTEHADIDPITLHRRLGHLGARNINILNETATR